jgi:hypothetical protein
MIRAAVILLALIAGISCGKYGPPVRAGGVKSTPAVAAVPAANASADTEECADPNSPVPGAGQTP